MKSEEFNNLFGQEFAKPLSQSGFEYVGRGQTLKYLKGNNELRLIRLGGRLSRPGAMVSVICFRHIFLRPVSTDEPNPKAVFTQDFSRKQVFQDFRGFLKPRPNYRPNNSGRWGRDTFEYGGSSENDVRLRLRALRKLFTNRIMPWANSITPEGELDQIKEFGEQAWCEMRWIEDYEDFLSGETKPSSN